MTTNGSTISNEWSCQIHISELTSTLMFCFIKIHLSIQNNNWI